MAETTINVVDALRGQQDQLKRLIAQKIWISDASKATLAEIEAQVIELKHLLTQLETDIQNARVCDRFGHSVRRAYSFRAWDGPQV